MLHLLKTRKAQPELCQHFFVSFRWDQKKYSHAFYYCLRVKSNPSLYSLFYAQTCNELPGPHSVSWCLQATQLLSKKIQQRWRALATLVFDLTGLNLKPPAPEENALQLNQLACLKKRSREKFAPEIAWPIY